MKVYVSRVIPQIGIDLLKNNDFEVEVWHEDRPMTIDELNFHSKNSDALLCMLSDKIDQSFLEQNKHLKVISQFAVGFDNIALSTATKLNIPIGNTPDVLSDATADTAFTLMMVVSRKAFYMHKKIISNEWSFFKPTANLGIEVKNKTLGIFGLGRIGFEMAKRCKGAYNMKIIYYNRSNNYEAEKELDAKKVSFQELLSQSDVLSVHSSLSDETKEIFNLSAFKQMKETAIFINTARGQIHNEIDLITALNENIIWGAGLDVTNPEPMKPDNPLLFMPNAAVLPHIGSATEEARNGMSKLAAKNIIAGLIGERLPHIVNPEIYK